MSCLPLIHVMTFIKGQRQWSVWVIIVCEVPGFVRGTNEFPRNRKNAKANHKLKALKFQSITDYGPVSSLGEPSSFSGFSSVFSMKRQHQLADGMQCRGRLFHYIHILNILSLIQLDERTNERTNVPDAVVAALWQKYDQCFVQRKNLWIYVAVRSSRAWSQRPTGEPIELFVMHWSIFWWMTNLSTGNM